MDIKAFINRLEAYYGQYKNPAVKAAIIDYYYDFKPKELDALYRLVIINYSTQWNKQPDLAILEKIRRTNRDEYDQLVGDYEKDGEVYRNGRFIGHYDGNRFVPALYLLNKEQALEYRNNYRLYDNPEDFEMLIEEVQSENKILEFKNSAGEDIDFCIKEERKI